MTFANLQGSRVQIYEGTSESRVLATYRGDVCETSVRAGVWTYSLLLWQNEPCAGGIEVLGLSVRQNLCAAKRCGNRAMKCRRPQSAVYNLRSTVCGGRWRNDGPRTDLQTRERPVLCGCSVLLLRAGAGRWIYGMQMRQVRRFGALDSKNDPQKDFYHKEHQTHIDRICNASITRHPPWKKKRSARSRLLLLA